MGNLITISQLRLVVPNLTQVRAELLTSNINSICPKYGIDTKDILHEFLANVAHESGGFRLKEENMRYTTARRIVQVWPTRFALPVPIKRDGKTVYVVPNNKIDPTPFVNNPKKLANLTYGGRMGNRYGTDDGYNMRGGGYMGLTGYYIYEKYRQYNNFDTIENMADAVRTDEYYAMDSAAWVFAVELKLNPMAEIDNFIGIVRKINGGLIGLDDRKQYYKRAVKYII